MLAEILPAFYTNILAFQTLSVLFHCWRDIAGYEQSNNSQNQVALSQLNLLHILPSVYS